MSPTRRSALAAGLLYLATIVSSIPALALIQPILTQPDYVLGDGPANRVVFGIVLDLVNVAAAIGTAVALYPIIRRRHQTLAIGFVASRLLEGATLGIGALALVAVVTLRRDPGTASDETLVAASQSLVSLRDATFLLAPGLLASVNAALLGTALYRARLVPRGIPLLGLIGAPLLFASTLATLVGVFEQLSPWSVVATLPIFLWELSLGLHLTLRGVTELDHDDSAPAPRPDRTPADAH
ncbi:hypothetical protein GCM10023153_26350 [Ornithinibacter aureus]|uniref:DUF4386 domain-containing protein n=1 Tax=Ornithinibacter aureus TaxID=622664 RepID=A0ABP8K2S4_9MICO|nr:DUF4386 domain-containing protein [Ornithinibacter aureus]KAF0832446.1 uncharacterized protein DUF4386 [Ornithinibacter aureus]